jgi:hypothetical protein
MLATFHSTAGSLAIATVGTSSTAQARYWRGWGWGLGAFALGAVVGSALARPYYGYPYYGYGYYGYPAYYGYPHILRTPTAMLIPPMATTDRAIGMRAGTPTRAIVGKA